MDLQGLLSLLAAVLCVIALPISLFNRESSKMEAVIFAVSIFIFCLYAWMHTTAEFREELTWLTTLIR